VCVDMEVVARKDRRVGVDMEVMEGDGAKCTLDMTSWCRT
jgi:hypothetical protein